MMMVYLLCLAFNIFPQNTDNMVCSLAEKNIFSMMHFNQKNMKTFGLAKFKRKQNLFEVLEICWQTFSSGSSVKIPLPNGVLMKSH